MRGPRYTIGIDVGGTMTRVALIGEGTGVVARRTRSTPRPHPCTPADETYQALLAGLAEDVSALTERMADRSISSVRCIGVAIAGLVDRAGGCVRRSVNLPYCEGRPFAADLGSRFASEVLLCTDIQAAGWAEWRAAGQAEVFAHLRLGTGVGYTELQAGRFVELSREPGRHPDLLRLSDAPERRCGCGASRCLESYVSRSAFSLRPPAGDMDRTVPLGALRECVDRLRQRLGSSGMLVIGGGLLGEHEFLRQSLDAFMGAAASGRAAVHPAQCDDDAGVLGASGLACAAGSPCASPAAPPSGSVTSAAGGGSGR